MVIMTMITVTTVRRVTVMTLTVAMVIAMVVLMRRVKVLRTMLMAMTMWMAMVGAMATSWSTCCLFQLCACTLVVAMRSSHLEMLVAQRISPSRSLPCNAFPVTLDRGHQSLNLWSWALHSQYTPDAKPLTLNQTTDFDIFKFVIAALPTVKSPVGIL